MILAAVIVALVPSVANAQELAPEQNQRAPRFGVGAELMKPVWRTASADWNNSAGIELQFTYRSAEKRSWRLGYAFTTSESAPVEVWGFRDTGVQVSYSGWYDRVHQLSVGHQWYLGDWRLRPFLGLDAYFGYEEVGNSSSRATYSYDSLQVGVGFGEPVARESTWRYYEGLHVGFGGAVGLEYRPHRHLSLQLRASLGQFWAVPLIEENADRFGQYGYGRLRFPQVGTGVFVQFEF
jgi:hypothetical protein